MEDIVNPVMIIHMNIIHNYIKNDIYIQVPYFLV